VLLAGGSLWVLAAGAAWADGRSVDEKLEQLQKQLEAQQQQINSQSQEIQHLRRPRPLR
jgi:uncharacterized protein YdgA (DUF945 family)